MSANTVCRVCLVHNLNLNEVRKDLQNMYERITGQKYINAGYPASMCYICMSVLQKCYLFSETARDTNKFLEQWYNSGQPNEMRMVKPLTTYSVSKTEVVSLGNKEASKHDIKLESMDIKQEIQPSEMTSMEEIQAREATQPSEMTPCEDIQRIEMNHHIKVEEVDLEPDYIEYDTDVRIDETDMDEQTYITDLFLEDPKASTSALEDVANDGQTDISLNTKTSHDILDFNSPPSQVEVQVDNKKKLKSKLSKNNRTNTKAKLNKIIKSNAIQLKTTITEKQDKNEETNSKLKTNNNKYMEVYKYCKECNLKCVTKNELARHMRLHDSSRPHVCDVCGWRFGYTGHLYNHKATIHGIGRVNEYFCEKCDFKTINKLNLTRHMTTHTGEKPFSCNVCDFKCRHKGHLKIHMRIHTGEKPFSCDVCDYKCAEKGNLNLHMRKHSGENPFSCDVCTYKCLNKSDLNKHKRLHTGVKPYSCTECDYKSIQKTALNTHMRTHTGLKPYSCSICNYNCVNSNTMQRHLLIKHFTVEDLDTW